MSKDGVYVCIDIGVNWEGDASNIIKMSEDAIDANVDAVKFQWFDKEYLDANKYDADLKKLLKSMCLTRDFFEAYIPLLHNKGMEVVITPFSMRQLEQMPKDVDGIKIRAADCFKTEMIRKAQSFGKPVYVSVPTVDGYLKKPSEVPEGVFFELMSCLMRPNTYMVMCPPGYPQDTKDLHLHRVVDFQGFSSHGMSHAIPLIAATIAVNAQQKAAKRRFYLEVHYTFTDDTRIRDSIPDMDVSLRPDELEHLTYSIKLLEESI